MKRAVILHGTSGNPSINWLPWVRAQLEDEGYEVWVPQLPDADYPNRFTYDEFLKSADWDFTDNLLIGHSSGATTILNLMSTDWFPHIKTAVLVGAFLNENLTKKTDWYEQGQFDNLFPSEGFDAERLSTKADRFYFLHGDNDPYCELEPAQQLSDKVNGTLVVIPGGKHLSSNRKEIPEIIDVLKKNNDL